MKTFLLILTAIIFFSCNSKKEDKTSSDSMPTAEVKIIPDCSIALKFINDYVGFITSQKKLATDSNWIEHNSLLTADFKLAYKTLIDSAQKQILKWV